MTPEFVTSLYRNLETEVVGADVYRTAITCASRGDLQRAWQDQLAQAEHHVRVIRETMETLGLTPQVESPTSAVRSIGGALVKAMKRARVNGDQVVAERVATECVGFVSTKDRVSAEIASELGKQLRFGTNGSTSSRDAN